MNNRVNTDRGPLVFVPGTVLNVDNTDYHVLVDELDGYGPVYQHGHISIENAEIIQRLPLADCDIGLQIATDGRIWMCVNGVAWIRFKPTPKGNPHSHAHAVEEPPERESPSGMYRAKCDCGWTGQACYDQDQARTFGVAHIEHHRTNHWKCEADHG